ncbi:unnamed protein product [Fusarium graminearum]|nr:unnamed protein product [Fusarium graminearum]CAG2003615.1 unnamed protein product [Fusarium graminearum]VTO92360.1 unnamed protein product [Fusarium graminearum]
MADTANGLADTGWVGGMEGRRRFTRLGCIVTAEINSYGASNKNISLALGRYFGSLELRWSSRWGGRK